MNLLFMHNIYKFKNQELINSALTHPSAQKKQPKYLFEHLEFLGDRVLGLSVASMLYAQNLKSIKMLACKHARFVSGEFLAQIAEKWELKKLLKHEIESISQKVLADAVEAVIGAIYLDSNYETAAEIIEETWKQFINIKTTEPKMELQELTQKKCITPTYETIDEAGYDHEKIYTVKVKAGNIGSATGKGRSKQAASKQAAINLLIKLRGK